MVKYGTILYFEGRLAHPGCVAAYLTESQKTKQAGLHKGRQGKFLRFATRLTDASVFGCYFPAQNSAGFAAHIRKKNKSLPRRGTIAPLFHCLPNTL